MTNGKQFDILKLKFVHQNVDLNFYFLSKLVIKVGESSWVENLTIIAIGAKALI